MLHCQLIGAVERPADLAADKRAEERADADGNHFAAALADLRTGDAAGHSAEKRAEALFLADSLAAACQRQRGDAEYRELELVHGCLLRSHYRRVSV